MRTFPPVDEKHSGFISYAKRPLFPSVIDPIVVGTKVPSSGPQMAYEDLETMGYEIEWLNLAWAKRIPLSINSSQIPTTQTNFPLLINSIFPDLIGATLDELRFTGINNVQLKYEIQKFDTITGELIAWVKMPTITDGDIIHIYYDNPAAIDEQNPPAVWDANYKSVYHGETDGKDSTVNTQNLTQFGTAQTPVSSKIGNGMDYGGTVLDYSIKNPYSGFPLIAITAEYWVKTLGTLDGMVSYSVGLSTLGNEFLMISQADLGTYIQGFIDHSGLSFNDGVFHHIVATWRSSDGQLIVYVDGVPSYSIIIQLGASFTPNGSLVLGQDQDNVGDAFDPIEALGGILDEIRLSDNFRSADYVKTTFNNQNNPSAFYSIGTVETPGIPDKMVYEG